MNTKMANSWEAPGLEPKLHKFKNSISLQLDYLKNYDRQSYRVIERTHSTNSISISIFMSPDTNKNERSLQGNMYIPNK
jgi:hypothetical protein